MLGLHPLQPAAWHLRGVKANLHCTCWILLAGAGVSMDATPTLRHAALGVFVACPCDELRSKQALCEACGNPKSQGDSNDSTAVFATEVQWACVRCTLPS